MAFLAHRKFIFSIISAFKFRHLKALFQIFLIIKSPLSFLYIYLTGKGTFPGVIKVKTPLGLIKISAYSYHDILTINEVFCRFDYKADNNDKIILDIGSNIGISALYFLTRSPLSYCYLYEPNPMCVERLRQNLEQFKKRYKLYEFAVSDFDGFVEFGTESTGRYGGIGLLRDDKINVECKSINGILENTLRGVEYIDILKIDTEGSELKTLLSISKNLLEKIRKIYIEDIITESIHEDLFFQKQYGTIYQLIKKS